MAVTRNRTRHLQRSQWRPDLLDFAGQAEGCAAVVFQPGTRTCRHNSWMGNRVGRPEVDRQATDERPPIAPCNVRRLIFCLAAAERKRAHRAAPPERPPHTPLLPRASTNGSCTFRSDAGRTTGPPPSTRASLALATAVHRDAFHLAAEASPVITHLRITVYGARLKPSGGESGKLACTGVRSCWPGGGGIDFGGHPGAAVHSVGATIRAVPNCNA